MPQYVFETTVQPSWSLGVSQSEIITSRCNILCWTITAQDANYVGELYTPPHPIQCDVNQPCGIAPSNCIDLRDSRKFTFPKASTVPSIFRSTPPTPIPTPTSLWLRPVPPGNAVAVARLGCTG